MAVTEVGTAKAWFASARQRRAAWAAVGATVLIALVAGVAYTAGATKAHRVTVLVGSAHVGEHEATIEAHGWFYGVVDSVGWIDAAGSWHDSGWPACLAPLGSNVTVKFGEVPVTGPSGARWRQVVWIDCRGALTAR